MRISDWSSDVCSSDLAAIGHDAVTKAVTYIKPFTTVDARIALQDADNAWQVQFWVMNLTNEYYWNNVAFLYDTAVRYAAMRSEEHTSELKSLMCRPYAVFCLTQHNRHRLSDDFFI